MSAAQTVAIQEILIKHKFSKKEATEILDYMEDVAKEQAGGWVKWVVGISLPIIVVCLLAVFDALWDLKTTSATKTDMQVMESRLLKAIEEKR